jgi:hypothetical protein
MRSRFSRCGRGFAWARDFRGAKAVAVFAQIKSGTAADQNKVVKTLLQLAKSRSFEEQLLLSAQSAMSNECDSGFRGGVAVLREPATFAVRIR